MLINGQMPVPFLLLVILFVALPCAELQHLNAWWTHRIRGYSSNFSYVVGDTVEFLLSCTNLAEIATIEINRVGYFDGAGQLFMATLQTSPQNDTMPASENTTTHKALWSIPGSSQPGLYVATVRQSGKGEASGSSVHSVVYIPFVVRWPEQSTKGDILVRVADLTWRIQSALAQGILHGNGSYAALVSYDSPWDITSVPESTHDYYRNTTFGAEAATIYWLEKHGYDVSYCSCADFEQMTENNLLVNYNVLLSAGDDHYWTPGMRAAYHKARADGIHAVFLSASAGQRTVHWSAGGNHSCTTRSERRSFTINMTDLAESRPETPISIKRHPISSQQPHSAANVSTVCVQQQLVALARDHNCHRTGHHGSTGTAISDTISASRPATTFTAGFVEWGMALSDHASSHNATMRREVQQATLDLLADMGVLPGAFKNSSDRLFPPLVQPTLPAQHAPPTSVIQHVKFEMTPRGNAVKVVGRAEAQDGGEVAAVEVSLDGGASWHLADGSARWHFIHYFVAASSQAPKPVALRRYPEGECHTVASYRAEQFEEGALYSGECTAPAHAGNLRQAHSGSALQLLIMTRATGGLGSKEAADPLHALCAVHSPKLAEVLPTHNRSHAHSAHFETHSGKLFVDTVAPNAVLLKVVGANLCATPVSTEDLVPNRNVLIVVQAAAILMLLCGALIKLKVWRWIAQ